jgi:hypothetical protein
MYQLYKEELNKGYAYVYKRDKCFRPIFVMNVGRMKKCKTDHASLVNISMYMLQYVITRGLVPGKVENWIAIVDMKGVGLTEIPKKLMKAMSKPL